jgi:hypothetical protein
MFTVRYQFYVYKYYLHTSELSARGYIFTHLVPGGYKYGDLGLQVGESQELEQ